MRLHHANIYAKADQLSQRPPSTNYGSFRTRLPRSKVTFEKRTCIATCRYIGRLLPHFCIVRLDFSFQLLHYSYFGYDCLEMEGFVEKSTALARPKHKSADVPENQAWISNHGRAKSVAHGILKKQKFPVVILFLLLYLTGIFLLWIRCGTSFFSQHCISKLLFSTRTSFVPAPQFGPVLAATGTHWSITNSTRMHRPIFADIRG